MLEPFQSSQNGCDRGVTEAADKTESPHAWGAGNGSRARIHIQEQPYHEVLWQSHSPSARRQAVSWLPHAIRRSKVCLRDNTQDSLNGIHCQPQGIQCYVRHHYLDAALAFTLAFTSSDQAMKTQEYAPPFILNTATLPTSVQRAPWCVASLSHID